jgi:transcriptional regulator with XRE-family HTH domain
MGKPIDDAIRSRLGARIRALRTARGLEQGGLGTRVDCTQEYISQLEHGDRSPSWETLVDLAHTGFEIELASLMFGIDEDLGFVPDDLSDVIAGRPLQARRDLVPALQSMVLMLRAEEDRSRAGGEPRYPSSEGLKAPGRRRTVK